MKPRELLVCALFGALTFGVGYLVGNNAPKPIINKQKVEQSELEEISIKYYKELPIHFEDIRFPSSWKNYDIKTTKIPQRKRLWKFNQLIRELEHYPAGLVEVTLDNIYLLDSLSVDGIDSWGGTRSLRDVYLTDPRSFHPEFSSILYLQNKSLFPETEWTQINDPLFRYSNNENETVNTYGESAGSNNLYQAGFVSEYATTSFENDYNEIFKFLFEEPNHLFELGKRYPQVNRKIDLTISFLSQLTGQEIGRDYFLK